MVVTLGEDRKLLVFLCVASHFRDFMNSNSQNKNNKRQRAVCTSRSRI